MRRIRLIVAWDGTDFSGWQRQDVRPSSGGHNPTIQGEIEKALAGIHGEPVTLYGAGRTDSGVHAAGQCAHFLTGIDSMPADRFVPALNSALPQSIRILESAEAPPGFHARFDAVARTYRYFFIPGRRALPHETRFALPLRRVPDIALLNGYARLLRGEMDCTLFAGAGDPSKSRHRFLFGASFFMDRDILVFEITANAFLWKMVRSVGGTFLYYAEKNVEAETLRAIIKSGDRSRAGPTLPPQGLFLWKVDYRPNPSG